MHPLWQIKQINTFEGLRHIDQNMAFGTRMAPRIWCSFFGLVMWIAIYVYFLPDLLHYMDDAWSYEMDPTLSFHKPYNTWYPKKQKKCDRVLWGKTQHGRTIKTFRRDASKRFFGGKSF